MINVDVKHDAFQGISDPTRRKILQLLTNNEMSIASITNQFTISRNAINKHLKILLSAGLVQKEISGREALFMIEPKPLLEIKNWLSFFDKYWDKKLQNLKNFVESND